MRASLGLTIGAFAGSRAAPSAHSVRHALGWVTAHTGVPLIVVAAFAIVISWRIFKRSIGLVVEVALALALLVLGTKLGWISW